MSDDTRFRFVYITARSKDQAMEIGGALIADRLAACVNILHPMTSLYWWEGEVQQGDETVLIAKTVEDQMEMLSAKVKALHSDDCPCVVSLAVQEREGNRDFLDWIGSQTGPAGNGSDR